MDDYLVILDPDPVFEIELADNPAAVDPPDLYQIAVQQGFIGSREAWLDLQFKAETPFPDLLTIYQTWKI